MPKPDELTWSCSLLDTLCRHGRPLPLADICKFWSKEALGDDGLSRNAIKTRLDKLTAAKWVRQREDGYLPHTQFLALSVRARKAFASQLTDVAEIIQLTA